MWGPAAAQEAPCPAQLTSILQVMTPGSLPTARKALLRDMALGFPGLKHHRAGREMTPLRAGIPPALLLSHFPISRQPSGHILTAHPCTVVVS